MGAVRLQMLTMIRNNTGIFKTLQGGGKPCLHLKDLLTAFLCYKNSQ